MDTTRSPLTEGEIGILRHTLMTWQEKEISWIMTNHGDIEYTLGALRFLSQHDYVVKFYEGDYFYGILAFNVGDTWWTPNLICSELFVLATLGTHGFQRIAAAELERIAKEAGASLILAGNIFQVDNNLIGNGYKKCGFRQECSTYVKEITT
jgi:hypothetical protein